MLAMEIKDERIRKVYVYIQLYLLYIQFDSYIYIYLFIYIYMMSYGFICKYSYIELEDMYVHIMCTTYIQANIDVYINILHYVKGLSRDPQ